MIRLAWTAFRRRSTHDPATTAASSSDSLSTSTSPRHSRPRAVDTSHPAPAANPTHRDRVLAMRLAHSRLCSPKRASQLEAIGVFSLGDLAYGDLAAIAGNFRATARATRQLRRYRRAIRLAASVPSLSPADALVLVSVHRPHPQSLAAQSAAALRRDLLRYANSSTGQSLLRGRPVPSIRRIKRWIEGAAEVAAI